MNKKITIAIDAMGGDNSPDKTVQGIGVFINHFVVILIGTSLRPGPTGDQAKLELNVG